MSRQIQIRRGDVAANDNFIGAVGEVTMDTTNNTLRVHDGETVGGTVLAKQDEIPDLSSCMKRPDYFNQITAQNNVIYYADCDYIVVCANGAGVDGVLKVSKNKNMENYVKILEILINTTGDIFFMIPAIIPKGCYYQFVNFSDIRLFKMY